MELSEKAMQFLEEQIPELAQSSVKEAYWRALAAGCNVLISENNILIEVHPDGSRTQIKQIPPSFPVAKGQRLII